MKYFFYLVAFIFVIFLVSEMFLYIMEDDDNDYLQNRIENAEVRHAAC